LFLEVHQIFSKFGPSGLIPDVKRGR
jgi:hypothetical protein